MRTHHGHWSYLYQLIAVNRDFDTARLIILCYEQMEMADFLKPASTSEGELRSAVQRMLLCGDSLIGRNRVCDHPSIAMLDKDEANLFLGIVSMEMHEMGVTLSKYAVRNDDVMRIRTQRLAQYYVLHIQNRCDSCWVAQY